MARRGQQMDLVGGRKAAFEVKAGSNVYGESLQNVIHPEDQEALESAIARSIAEGVPCDVEFRINRNGRTRWFLSERKSRL